MEECSYCGGKARLYFNGKPVCVSCAQKVDLNKTTTQAELAKTLSEAKLRTDAAFKEFTTLINGIPSGLPQPDGAQRIQNAAVSLRVAQRNQVTALNRLREFLEKGIVPDDLKRSG